ncbi:4806_t:CDS:2, partial [Funneliformis mosseae]
VKSLNTPIDNNMEKPEKSDMKDQTDNIQSIDIYKVQLKRDRSLKSLALSILKYLPEDILQDSPKSLILNVCGNIIHQTCARKPDKRGVLECSCGMANNKNLSLSSEEMDVNEENNEDGEIESTLPEETGSTSNSKSKKLANEYTDSSASKKFKKRDLDEDFNILKRLIQELSSDTTQILVIKEKKGLQRESMQEDRSTQIFFDLYFKITNAEERNEKACYELIIAYCYYGEELEKCLVHYREGYKEHEVLKKLYDKVKDQLPKEVTKSAIRKKLNK